MHVAALQIFSMPGNAPRGFVKRVVQKLRAPQPIARPWNLKLAAAPLSALAPAVAEACAIDMDYHVRHVALPDPGGERELGELVSHLHGQLLDRSRPLWTCHVIEGLENGRFAIYIKMHHALVDGVAGIRLATRSLADTPDGMWTAPWHWQASRKGKTRPSRNAPQSGNNTTPWGLTRQLFGALRAMARRERGQEPIRVPFEAPRSILNGPVTAARRVATQQMDFARIKAIAGCTGTSVNDVFLAICGAALRRHLMANDALPTSSLIVGVPVSLRDATAAAAAAGNAVGFVWAVLGTDIADPARRLRAIHDSMLVSKNNLQSLPPLARRAFTILTSAPMMGVLMSGLGARVRPPMNLIISNVPGPERTLYLEGARLEALYPISVPMQGHSLNITCISYAGQLNVGFTGSRDSLPHLQRIAVYAGEALDELDRCTQASAANAATPAARRSAR